jgi:hypothetical protein
MRINLPTIDHGEMGQRDMLALACDGVHSFLNGRDSDITVNQHKPAMAGSRLHRLISNQTDPTIPELEKLLEHPDSFNNADQLMALLHLIMMHGKQDRIPALIEAVVLRNPQSRFIQYVRRRLQRDTRMLCPNDIVALVGGRLSAVERVISLQKPLGTSPRPKPLRLLFLAYDVGWAVLKAQYHRFR